MSSQKCQKRNWAILDEILIKSGDTNAWTFTACRQQNTFSYHILFNNKHNILHYITNLPYVELTAYSNLSKSQFQCSVQTKEAAYRITVNNNNQQRRIDYTVLLLY